MGNNTLLIQYMLQVICKAAFMHRSGQPLHINATFLSTFSGIVLPLLFVFFPAIFFLSR